MIYSIKPDHPSPFRKVLISLVFIVHNLVCSLKTAPVVVLHTEAKVLLLSQSRIWLVSKSWILITVSLWRWEKVWLDRQGTVRHHRFEIRPKEWKLLVKYSYKKLNCHQSHFMRGELQDLSSYSVIFFFSLIKFAVMRFLPLLPGSWVHCNDARISRCPLEEVLQSQAYILFYVRHRVQSGGARKKEEEEGPQLKRRKIQWQF